MTAGPQPRPLPSGTWTARISLPGPVTSPCGAVAGLALFGYAPLYRSLPSDLGGPRTVDLHALVRLCWLATPQRRSGKPQVLSKMAVLGSPGPRFASSAPAR